MTSTEQLERETEQTRARLTETLEELRSMTPGRVVDEVLDYAKTGGGDFLRNMGSKLGHQVGENPLPAALIGAGVIWLMMSDGKAHNGPGTAMGNRRSGDGAGWSDSMDDTDMEASSLGEKAGSAIRGVKETAQSAASGLGGAASSLGETATGAYQAVSSTASRTAETVKSAASTVAQSTIAFEKSALAATSSFFDFAKDQPLVLAGLGLAIGAALGAALPETEAEERLMGEAAEKVKEKAQHLAAEQMQIAKQVGGHVVEETAKLVKQEVEQVVGGAVGEGQNQGQGQNRMGQADMSGNEQSDMEQDNTLNLPSDRQGADNPQNPQGGSDFDRPDGQARPFNY
jgi:hypothetical protein